MDFKEYQEEASTTAQYPGVGTRQGMNYTILGLVGEAGELANHFKKVSRDDGEEITPDRRDKMLGELGDVLWYLSQCAKEFGVSLEEIAQGNLDKLASRYQRGMIQGEGDKR